LRGLLAIVGTSVVLVGVGGALRSLGPTAPEFEAPSPSGGHWSREGDFRPGDERPNEPTVFMANSTPTK
jgi:hypothetical protein